MRLRRQQWQRRTWSTLVAVGLHAILVTALFLPLGPAGTDANDAGSGVEDAIEVTLVRAPASTASQAASASSGAVLPKHLAPAPDGLATNSAQNSAMANLMHKLSQTRRSDADSRPDQRRASDRTSLSQLNEEAREGAPSGASELGSSLKACWENVQVAAQTPITIEISLDGRGRLAKPPTIIRQSGAPLSETRLRSEAAVIAALGHCGVQANARFANSTQRVVVAPSQ